MKKIVFVSALATLLAACSSAPKAPEQAATPSPVANTAPAAAPATSAPVATGETPEQALARVQKALADKSVYFDYDKFTIKPEGQDVVRANKDAAASIPGSKVTVSGNADERGSAEYNLALGQKRAEAVKKALTLLGMPESQLEAISYGKEKPRATCHDESCWAQNRRVDFAVSK